MIKGINVGFTSILKIYKLEKIKTIETYIIDFNKNIYGENLKIIFKDYIRGQIKFENKKDLITQMDKDLKKVSEEN